MEGLKLLLVAHHLNPDWGSEPLIAWRWATHLQNHVDLQIVTHVRNREAIEARGDLRARIHYVDTERLARGINRINEVIWPSTAVVARSMLESLALRAFDRGAVKIARDLVRRGEVELIHRVSPISPKAPSGLGRLGVPFVIGPVNGGMQMAPGFDEVARLECEGAMRLRSLARLLDPRAQTFTDATAILVATETTRRSLPQSVADRARLLCENAVVPDLFTPRFDRLRLDGPLRLLYLGRLLPYKGVDFILRALARLPIGLAELEVVGEGPERGALESLRIELGLEGRVRFHGAVPVSEVPAWMSAADLFLLPSLRESGGSVLLEAMAAGTPVICLDHGGPAETVTELVGVKVSAASPDELESRLAAAIRELAADERRRAAMARAARDHVESNYSWRGKIEAAMDIYRDLLEAGRASLGRVA
jgi:alpha-maltose-1-phosphate synthase